MTEWDLRYNWQGNQNLDEIAHYFVTFFRDHSFLSYIVVAIALFIAVIGFAATRRLLGLKIKVWWGILLFYLFLLPIWFCIGLFGVVLMIFFKRLRVFFRF